MDETQLDDLKQFIDNRLTHRETVRDDDLKQFIDSRLSQSEERIKGELKAEIQQGENGLRSEMNRGFTVLRQEVNDGFAGVAGALEETNTRLDNFIILTDKRLTRLEQKTA